MIEAFKTHQLTSRRNYVGMLGAPRLDYHAIYG